MSLQGRASPRSPETGRLPDSSGAGFRQHWGSLEAQQAAAGGLPWISGLLLFRRLSTLLWDLLGIPVTGELLLRQFCHLPSGVETGELATATPGQKQRRRVGFAQSTANHARQWGPLTLRTFLMPLMVEVSKEWTLRSSLT